MRKGSVSVFSKHCKTYEQKSGVSGHIIVEKVAIVHSVHSFFIHMDLPALLLLLYFIVYYIVSLDAQQFVSLARRASIASITD